MTTREVLKMYSDYKSPYAWLAFDPALDLEQRFAVKLKWIPFQLRIKGSGQRSIYSEYKVKYSYMDARRTANERGDKKIIRGPLKIYDTAPALIGGMFAEKQGKIVEYSRQVFELFFKRELAVDEVDAVAKFMDEIWPLGKRLPGILRTGGPAGLRERAEGSFNRPYFWCANLHFPWRTVLGQ